MYQYMQISNTSLIVGSYHVKEDIHHEITLQEHFTLKGIIIGCMSLFMHIFPTNLPLVWLP